MGFVCVEQIRSNGDALLLEVIERLGGWPVTKSDWEPPAFSIEALLGRLRGEFSEPVLMDLFVGADDKNSSVHILQVTLVEQCALEIIVKRSEI